MKDEILYTYSRLYQVFVYYSMLLLLLLAGPIVHQCRKWILKKEKKTNLCLKCHKVWLFKILNPLSVMISWPDPFWYNTHITQFLCISIYCPLLVNTQSPLYIKQHMTNCSWEILACFKVRSKVWYRGPHNLKCVFTERLSQGSP